MAPGSGEPHNPHVLKTDGPTGSIVVNPGPIRKCLPEPVGKVALLFDSTSFMNVSITGGLIPAVTSTDRLTGCPGGGGASVFSAISGYFAVSIETGERSSVLRVVDTNCTATSGLPVWFTSYVATQKSRPTGL